MGIVVTGVGIVSALGIGVDRNLAAICKGESGISAIVLSNVATIYEDIGYALHSVETEKQSLTLPLGRHKECALIVCRGLEIGAITPESVDIPGVRQSYLAGIVARILLCIEELPATIQRVYFTSRHTRKCAKQNHC